VGVATVARSLVKVWNDTARIVDPADYRQYTWIDWSALSPLDGAPCIQTSRSCLRVPEVVTLTRYDRLPVNAVTFSRRNVFKRDRFTCQYCGRQPGNAELTIDHVMPRAQGGVSSWDNCVLACVDCNTRKADRTPQQAGLKLQCVPSRPRWKPFYASADVRISSWSRFVSDAYWNAELET
jgi:5-methylcytosine-specific restriction endonuclease McrA